LLFSFTHVFSLLSNMLDKGLGIGILMQFHATGHDDLLVNTLYYDFLTPDSN